MDRRFRLPDRAVPGALVGPCPGDGPLRHRLGLPGAGRFTEAGFSWALWNFNSDFGIYDDSAGVWNASLVAALLHPGSNPVLDSILASDRPIDLERFVVMEDFEDGVGGLPDLSRRWHDRQDQDYAASRATWYAFHSGTSSMSLPDGTRLSPWQEVRDGAEYNFPDTEGPWGYAGKGLHVQARLRGSGYPYIGFGAGVRGGWDSLFVDLSKVAAIQFRAKGRGDWILQVASDSIQNGYPATDNWGHMVAAFTLGQEWQDIVIPTATLAPKAWSKQAADGLTWEAVRDRIIAVEFMSGQSYGQAPDDSLEIWLDDIRLIGVKDEDLGL